MISPIGLSSLRSFYNKISDNVRGRIPSVMVRNHERLNPSDSKETNPLLRKAVATFTIAVAGILPMSACGETHSEPTPDTTISTAQNPTENTPSTNSPSPDKTPVSRETDVEEMLKPLKDWNYEGIDLSILDDKNASREDLVGILDQFIRNNYDNGEEPTFDPVTKKTAWSAMRIIRLVQMLSVDHSDEANYTRAMNLATAMFNPEKTEELEKFKEAIRKLWAASNPTSPTCKKELCTVEQRSLYYEYTEILRVSKQPVVVTNSKGTKDSVVRFEASGDTITVPSNNKDFEASPINMSVEVNTSNIQHLIELNEITFGVEKKAWWS
jgi:hypothetical protein